MTEKKLEGKALENVSRAVDELIGYAMQPKSEHVEGCILMPPNLVGVLAAYLHTLRNTRGL